jgi:hypothetical protein
MWTGARFPARERIRGRGLWAFGKGVLWQNRFVAPRYLGPNFWAIGGHLTPKRAPQSLAYQGDRALVYANELPFTRLNDPNREN